MQHGCKICGRGNSPAEFCQVASRGEVTVCGPAACSFCFHRPLVRIQTVDVKTLQTSRYGCTCTGLSDSRCLGRSSSFPMILVHSANVSFLSSTNAQTAASIIASNSVTTHIGTFALPRGPRPARHCSDGRLPALASSSTMPLDSMIGWRNEQGP